MVIRSHAGTPKGLSSVRELSSPIENLVLDLGVSIWMRKNDVATDDCRSVVMAIRSSLLKIGELDARTEPVPLFGISAQADLATAAAYLAALVARTASALDAEVFEVVELVSEDLAA